MDTNSPMELSAESLIRRIDAQELPREFVVMAARGLVPLPGDELIQVLLRLSASEDDEIRILSKAAIEDFPADVLLSQARSETSPKVLEQLARVVSTRSVLEEIVRNRATDDDTVVRLAKEVRGPLQEVIVINQQRVLRCPQILDALLENPHLLPDVRRRVTETRAEFFEKRRAKDEAARIAAEAVSAAEVAQREAEKAAAPEAGEVSDLSEGEQELLNELLQKVVEEGEDAKPAVEVPPDVVDEKEKSIWNRILTMSVSERVHLAFKAGKTERGILIRDRNKLVCTAVIRSPRLSESEVETFAAMRNIEGEILRVIGGNREWMGKYPIMSALVHNPKTPIAISMKLVPKLNARDLRGLSIDKGVPEAVRTMARRLFLARTQGGPK